MFCPNCGVTANQKLKYCKSCGERLSKAEEIDKDGTPGKMLETVLTTLFMIVMVGLGILVGLVAVLLGSNASLGMVAAIVLAWLLAIFGICFSLARQATKLIDYRLKSRHVSNEILADPRHLSPLTTAQLEEYREPAMNVTDQTTRTLDKLPVGER